MPNKTIYIADNDLPIFEKAQALAGSSLSAVISQALHNFVQSQESGKHEFQQITVKVGQDGNLRGQRFLGRLITRYRARDRKNHRQRIWQVFQTAKGRFAVYIRDEPYWDELGDEDYAHADYEISGTLEVYDTLEALKIHLPADLYTVIQLSLTGDEVEILDI